MKAIQLTSCICEDGMLQLNIPTEMPNQKVEIFIIIQAITPEMSGMQGEKSEWSSDFFEKTAGAFQNEPIERGEQGEYETREILR